MSGGKGIEMRSEPRRPAEDYHYVEFQVKKPGPIYQFKLWDISDHGLCILIKETSDVMKSVRIDEILSMTFFEDIPNGTSRQLTARIAHITKKETGRFKGHYLMGLSVIS